MVSVQMFFFPSSYPQDSFCWGFQNGQMIKIIIPALVSPKETVVGHGKSYLVRQIVTGRVAFTTLTHLLHWAFVILRVPGVNKEKNAVLHIQSVGLERFHTQTLRGVTPQSALAGDISRRVKYLPTGDRSPCQCWEKLELNPVESTVLEVSPAKETIEAHMIFVELVFCLICWGFCFVLSLSPTPAMWQSFKIYIYYLLYNYFILVFLASLNLCSVSAHFPVLLQFS